MSVLLRDWQRRFVDAYHDANQKTFVAVVCPAAGKTIGGLKIAFDLRELTICRKVFIVVHTENLRRQWIAEARRFGLELQAGYSPIAVAANGYVLTYQQLAKGGEALRHEVRRSKGLVIFDEIHHVGENKSWGADVRHIFYDAKRRLLLTGTAFRHDNERIAFVHYKNHVGQPDFTYGYAEALKDGYVRPVFFPSYETKTRFRLGGQVFTHSFEDVITDELDAKRLNATLSASGKYLRQLIADAHARLLDLRVKGHANAGGLITCIDQKHARAVAVLVKKVTGKEPVLAISDEGESAARIEAFKTSSDHWLVAVKMVSEGVDIPRLRVGVMASNVRTELFFRQFVGRFTRVIPALDGDQSAFVYLPAHPILKKHAQALQEERAHVVWDEPAVERREPIIREVRPVVEFNPLSAVADTAPVTLLSDGSAFTPDELARAEIVRLAAGMTALTVEAVARILRAGDMTALMAERVVNG